MEGSTSARACLLLLDDCWLAGMVLAACRLVSLAAASHLPARCLTCPFPALPPSLPLLPARRLFNPQSFLTAVKQTTARRNEWALDKTVIVTEVGAPCTQHRSVCPACCITHNCRLPDSLPQPPLPRCCLPLQQSVAHTDAQSHNHTEIQTHTFVTPCCLP